MEVIDKKEYISKIEVVRILQKAYAEGRIKAKDGCVSLLDDINALPSADVQPVSQWISVRDRFPETPEEGLGVRYSDCCLVCDSLGWCGMAYYLTDDKKSWWEFADAQNKVKIDWTEITHWMPLPEPPKDGEQNG